MEMARTTGAISLFNENSYSDLKTPPETALLMSLTV
jgi:hypothetical protein